MADWKDAAAYEYTRKHDSHGWAWEFLRRNPDYKKTWARLQAIEEDLSARFGPRSSWTSKVLGSREVWHFDPPINPDETESAWLKRHLDAGVDPYKSPFIEGLARGWGLVRLLNPAEPPSGKERFLVGQPSIWYQVSDIEIPSPLPAFAERAYVEIDLRQHIEPQIDRAKVRLMTTQRRLINRGRLVATRRKSEKKVLFGRYLRVLDAFAAEPRPTRKEIAESVFGESFRYQGERGVKAVDETRKQANRLVLGGYRSLI